MTHAKNFKFQRNFRNKIQQKFNLNNQKLITKSGKGKEMTNLNFLKNIAYTKKNFLSIFLLLIMCSVYVNAQNISWVRQYNGISNQNDFGAKSAADPFGNIFVLGQTYSNSNSDILLVKYDAAGNQLWTRTCNGSANSEDYGVEIVTYGTFGVIIGGVVTSTGSGEDYFLAMFDQNGIEVWSRIFNGPGNGDDNLSGIDYDAGGNVYATGTVWNGNVNKKDFMTVKYNQAGNFLWMQAYHNGDLDAAASVKTGSNGKVYVTGTSQIGTSNYYWIRTICYFPNGTFSNEVTFYMTPTVNTQVFDMAIDNYNNIYLTGFAYMPVGGIDIVTVEYNSDLGLQWYRNYNSPAGQNDIGTDIDFDASGNVYVCGSATIGNNSDFVTLKYDSQGNQQWSFIYNGPGNGPDVPANIRSDNSGNVYVSGTVEGYGSGSDFCTLKIRANGSLENTLLHSGPSNGSDAASDVIIDYQGNIIVTGSVSTAGSGNDLVLIKYTYFTGLNGNAGEIPSEFGLSQNYPNPFNPSTRISFDIASESKVSISVFDITGKKVAELVDENMKAGSYEVEWSASKLSSGTYFYRMQAGSFTETKKMILIK